MPETGFESRSKVLTISTATYSKEERVGQFSSILLCPPLSLLKSQELSKGEGFLSCVPWPQSPTPKAPGSLPSVLVFQQQLGPRTWGCTLGRAGCQAQHSHYYSPQQPAVTPSVLWVRTSQYYSCSLAKFLSQGPPNS